MSDSSTETIIIQMVEQVKASTECVKDIAQYRESTRRIMNLIPWILLGVVAVALSAAIVVVSFNYRRMHKNTLDFFSQYEFYYEEFTVNQDTGEGGGNNVYFPGEQATYNEGQ